jgi:hypothetical protein
MDESESSNAQSSREEPPQLSWHGTAAGFTYFVAAQARMLGLGSVSFSD